MSDEQLPTTEPLADDNAASDWVMPEPIFRSTEGHTPGAGRSPFEGDEHDTASPDEDVDAFAETLPNINPAEPQRANVKAAQPKKSGGCLQSLVLIIGFVGLSAAVIVAALVYLVVYYRPSDTLTF